jgi:hypothetical protein
LTAFLTLFTKSKDVQKAGLSKTKISPSGLNSIDGSEKRAE